MIKKFLYTSNLRQWRNHGDAEKLWELCQAYGKLSISRSRGLLSKLSFSKSRLGRYSLSREAAKRGSRW